MLKASIKYYFVPACIFCAVVLIDVAVKKVITFYSANQVLFGGYFVLGNFSNNKGLFGFMSLAVAVAASFVVFTFIFYLFSQSKSLRERTSLALILGGGVSNFCERLIYGRVTDVLAVGNFGVMNFADVAIFVGIVWYALLLIRKG